MSVVLLNNIKLAPICERELLRYAGVRDGGGIDRLLLGDVIREAEPSILPAAVYTELDYKTDGDICRFDGFSLTSRSLAKNLGEEGKAIVFCATLGASFDRLLVKYNRLSPSRALLLSALGTERVEALCDAVVSEYSAEKDLKLGRRFSPGYGDLSLSVQADVFSILKPEKYLGVTLSKSLLMTPTKSVTAFAAVIK